MHDGQRKIIRQRLADESGRLDKGGPRRVALAYPSPYAVAMSSLGFQWIYARLQRLPETSVERCFLPDGATAAGGERPVTYENLRGLEEFPLVCVSVAWELEVMGLVRLLTLAGLPLEAARRGADDPLVVVGGPITFSNPRPFAPFADAIVMGEGEGIAEFVVDEVYGSSSRASALAALSRHPHIFVPGSSAQDLPSLAVCDATDLPATSQIRTPHTELRDMFLIEAERGCSRSCHYCVMRRASGRGMRLVEPDVILDRVPADARKVGLVGAAVSDHPKIVEIVRSFVERGLEVGLSSLRPERLTDELVAALKASGYRTLTTALDGPSARLRQSVDRRTEAADYVAVAKTARRHGMDRLKLYLMLGLPGETEADIDECAELVSELSRVIPVALGISPFCAKRNTPLDGSAYAGVALVRSRLARLRAKLRGRADVRATSSRWAWVEHVLAQGAEAEGRAAAAATLAGGSFSDFRRAFGDLGHRG
jgi:radical SAM superfamily enzyme YgiQ (UPF0313 family)